MLVRRNLNKYFYFLCPYLSDTSKDIKILALRYLVDLDISAGTFSLNLAYLPPIYLVQALVLYDDRQYAAEEAKFR